MKLTIASWNIGEDESHDKCLVDLESYAFIKEIVEEYKIDILCMQEAITTSDVVMPIKEYLTNNTELVNSAEYEYAPSHINLGSMMGVETASKYPISSEEVAKFENPRLLYKIVDGVPIYMHDKGFIITKFNDLDLTIVNGHGIPFHEFKRDALDFLDIFNKAETDILGKLDTSSNFIILGDMNYMSFSKIFPRLNTLTNSNINEPTCISSKIGFIPLDYIMTSKGIKVLDSKVIDNRFDHKLCIVEIELKDLKSRGDSVGGI